MFAMVRAHWIDVGGTSAPASAPAPQVADPWLEGLQLDQLKIYEAGKLDETLYRVHPATTSAFRNPRSAT